MGKLVRDEIPAIIRAEGREANTRILADSEYFTELLKKLVEEAEEAATAAPASVLEELADVHEVILALLLELGTTPETLHSVATAKRLSKGGFTQRIYLES